MALWDNLTGVQGAKSGYLGKRFAYARRESKKGIRYDFLLPVLHEVGLGKYAPNQPTPADAFRRACQDIPKRYIYDKETNKKYKIGMINIDESADPIVRNIQLTEIDKKNQTSTDGKLVAQIQFERKSEGVHVYYGSEAGDEFDYCPEFVRDRTREAIKRYSIEAELVSEMQLHNLIQKALQDAGNPVNKISSTWNIPATREDLLDMILSLSVKLNEFEDGIFVVDTLPVVSTDETRSKVKADAVIYAVERLNSLYRKAQDDIVTTSSTNADKTKEKVNRQMQQEADKVMSLIEEYEQLLGDAMDEVRQAREITEAKLKEFAQSPERQSQYRETKRKLKAYKNDSGEKPSGEPKAKSEILANVEPITGRKIRRSVETQSYQPQEALAL